MKQARIAIMVGSKGRGSNLARLIQAGNANEYPGRVQLVLAPLDSSPALALAQELGIKTLAISTKTERYGDKLVEAFRSNSIDVVCLAGYLSLLPMQVIHAFPGRVLNIHPALLPKFGGKGMFGMHVHEAVAASQETESGATVHLVTEHYDEGAVVLQRACPVPASRDPHEIAEAVLKIEHTIYPLALDSVIRREFSS